MRFRNFLGLLAIVFISGCSSRDAVTISIRVKSPEKDVITLSKIDFNKIIKIDSVKISSGEDEKRFKIKQGEEPEFYSISTKSGKAITLLASKGERINVSVDLDKILDYQVSGSEGSKKVQWITKTFAKSKSKVDEQIKRYLQTETSTEREIINNEYNIEKQRIKDELNKFIWKNPMSKASIMALYQKYNDNLFIFDSSDDLQLIKMVASAWKALYPESNYTKGMLEDIKNLERTITNAKLQQLIQSSELPIPDLSIPDRFGKEIKLSSLKGKIILLDFITSENSTSLLDNRELMEIYKKYKGKGFEVYQISFDSSRDGWINYVENSSIPWICVRENEPLNSTAAMMYNVRQIPSNYLIGKDFNIIAKNIYGDNLRKILEQKLNN